MTRRKEKSVARKALDRSLPVFQLKITLEDIEPEIWRRIETPDCSLADLHEIIQSCMGWDDEHLHAFEIGDEQYTDLRRGGDRREFDDSRSMWLSDILDQREYRFDYEYDFGDSWRHVIEIESTLPAEENVRYPRCMDGGRACPPEDCGGAYGYCDLLDALANQDKADGENAEDEYYDERLEWLGEDFDPEKFNVDEVNEEFLRLRRWIGRRPSSRGPSFRFTPGDRIRVKRGVAHSEYPDIPLGGWVGTVTRIAWLVPISYKVRWAEETLAAAHPIYAKRCRRDEEKPQTHWLDEGEIESDCPEQPMEMEQPTNLVARPLSQEDEDDRVRMVFGLTADDPLPAISDETQRQYLDYLRLHLTFPFEATYWSELTQHSQVKRDLAVVGLAPLSPASASRSLLCEACWEGQTEQIALTDLQLDGDDPNSRYVDDYRYWLWDAQDHGDYDEDDSDEADGDDEEDDDEEGEEFWDDEDEEHEDDEDLGPRLGGNRDDSFSGPQPIHRGQPPVGRNDPCPCGSGKKFKKCCLKKPNGGLVE